MLVDIRTKELIDIYPHADNPERARGQTRITIIYGKVYKNGNVWTKEAMQREVQRVRELEQAFKVTQRILECQNNQNIDLEPKGE